MGIKGFFIGIFSPFYGISFINRHKKWKFIFIPMIISIIIAMVLFFLSINFISPYISSFIMKLAPANPDTLGALTKAIYYAISFLSKVLTLTLSLAIVIMLFSSILEIVFSPFIEPIIKAVENATIGKEIKPKSSLRNFIKGLQTSIVSLSLFVGIQIIALIISIIPIIGPMLYVLISWLTTSYIIGFSALDITMSKHISSIKKKWELSKKYKGLLIGTGTTTILFFSIPIIGSILGGGIIYPSAIIGIAIYFYNHIYTEKNEEK